MYFFVLKSGKWTEISHWSSIVFRFEKCDKKSWPPPHIITFYNIVSIELEHIFTNPIRSKDNIVVNTAKRFFCFAFVLPILQKTKVFELEKNRNIIKINVYNVVWKYTHYIRCILEHTQKGIVYISCKVQNHKNNRKWNRKMKPKNETEKWNQKMKPKNENI